MLPVQLLLIGLPVLPEALDRYLQSKVKQFFITPISNLIHTLMIEGAKTFIFHLLEAIQFIVQLVLGIVQVVYKDIITVIAYIVWGVLWLMVYMYLTLLFIGEQCQAFGKWFISLVTTGFMCLSNIGTSFVNGVNSVYSGITNYTTTSIIWILTQIINFIWYLATNIFSVLHLAFTMVFLLMKFAIVAIVLGIVAYIGIIIYQFFNCCHFLHFKVTSTLAWHWPTNHLDNSAKEVC